MKITIVGAGIAGLSLAIALKKSKTTHHVSIVESEKHLAELGAGVQLTPQAVKYLFQWGLKEDLLNECIKPEKILFKDWKDSRLIGALDMTSFEEEYGAPYIVIHRATLLAILYRHAISAGVVIYFVHEVTDYRVFEDTPDIEIDGGRNYLDSSLVIAADGINSFARSQLLGADDPGTKPTGWAALRMMAEVSKIKANPVTANLVDLSTHNSNFWVAPDRSCMVYLIKDASMLNIVLSHRDDVDMKDCTYEEHKKVIYDLFGDFDLPVKTLLDLALPKITNYPVHAVPPLPTWSNPSGTFALVGDAAHAMAFYMSMGVSLAIEDAISLSTALDLAYTNTNTNTHSLNAKAQKHALDVFEHVRKRRVAAVQSASLQAGNSYHVSEGKERKALYELISRCNESVELELESESEICGMSGEEKRIPCQGSGEVGGLANQHIRDWCYGYDAIGEIEAYFMDSEAENGKPPLPARPRP
ncbi:hypothetical protein N7466_003111 [Penicillium verhagenii]|uniref:uncharacterized protein n=1 Tax=Penicillium verhagenii TaxID=1562060 RepID=UPI0025454E4B|nr:uncharacterized protein N7466_003111 [Penicillium verhagenii]KAJ5936661.1 hypothetical protein N7466_003111 [Penicillium verhagenii]